MKHTLIDGDGDRAMVDAEGIDLASGVRGLGRFQEAVLAARVESQVCPLCGWTLKQYIETQRVGCGLCHSVFVSAVEAERDNQEPE